jgi:WhiB family redox-sensing transcriptional regulator
MSNARLGRPRTAGDVPGLPPESLNDGLCTQNNPEVFYPETGVNATVARAICRRCPMLERCGLYALDTTQHWGVWGGLTEKERGNMRGTAMTSEQAEQLLFRAGWRPAMVADYLAKRYGTDNQDAAEVGNAA